MDYVLCRLFHHQKTYTAAYTSLPLILISSRLFVQLLASSIGLKQKYLIPNSLSCVQNIATFPGNSVPLPLRPEPSAVRKTTAWLSKSSGNGDRADGGVRLDDLVRRLVAGSAGRRLGWGPPDSEIQKPAFRGQTEPPRALSGIVRHRPECVSAATKSAGKCPESAACHAQRA
jgi:hypothetical protein